ncbi:inosine-uridine nucleoside N-ribohydrolase [Nocardia tenerifensis]|uniref:Inosine-uridine nucleoside N-ribohydrolase n=1 Tax=Nocardia tenerifensis TaxID=228006 RepID=A0A318KGL7_9NOCA|nr:nucleoside hydrolase [Nocardia tenerifensis]PXX71333.1 inosine-uridine nucleoside N-ribohydrolase [Nocardia tenerifensis]
MGDTDPDEPRESLESMWSSLLGFADRYAELGYGPLAAKLRAGGPPPPRVQHTPVIVDTDIGGDPDDAVALTCAARTLPELALVLTTDENGGGRARFARHLLDLHGRHDVPVVAGADLGNTRYYVVDGLTPDDVPAQPTDVLDAVRTVCASTDRHVRWVGMGPLTNLSAVLREAPELVDRLVVTQMGGAINYRDPARAEHNFRLDPDAARAVVATAADLLLVLSDVTFTEQIAISTESDTYRLLAAEGAPEWARLLRTHLDRWFTAFYPSSMQHDPLALATALQLPFVDFTRRRIALAPDARMSLDPEGHFAWVTTQADYPAFRSWLTEQLAY